jgi:hypothetical protein
MAPKKIVRIPLEIGGFDKTINKYKPVIDTPEFQRLRWIKNCDLVFQIYPGLTNTRFEHSCGTLHEVTEIIRNINDDEEARKLDETERSTVELAALLHDIGHSAFSHALEEILISFGEPTHDEKALEKLERLRSKIGKIPSVDFSLLREIFKRKSPFSTMIWSKVGADVLDYLQRDAMHAGVNLRSDTERIKTYAFFDGKYGIDSKAAEAVGMHLLVWLHQYTIIYLRKGSNLWKGLLRTGCYELMEDENNLEKFWEMTDDELLAELKVHEGLPRKIYYRIKHRNPPKTFLTIKIKGKEAREEIRKKPIHVYGLPEEELMKIVEYCESDVKNIMELERELERELEFEKGDVTVAEMPHIKYIQPENIDLFDRERGWTSLYDQIPEYKEMYHLTTRRIYAFRLGTRPELRKKAYENIELVLETLLTTI